MFPVWTVTYVPGSYPGGWVTSACSSRRQSSDVIAGGRGGSLRSRRLYRVRLPGDRARRGGSMGIAGAAEAPSVGQTRRASHGYLKTAPEFRAHQRKTAIFSVQQERRAIPTGTALFDARGPSSEASQNRMTILQTDRIDLVATRPDSSVVKLVITDVLDWDDFENHVRLLQDKLNTYLAFVETGQLARMKDPPIPRSPDIHIVLALPHAPTRDATALFAEVREFLANVNIAFDVEVHA